MIATSHRPVTVVQPVSILLVDDNPAFRNGLRNLLDFYNGTGSLRCQVVGHAATVDQALQLSTEQCPTLIFLDLELGQENGLAFLERFQPEERHSTRVLVLSAHREDEWIFQAMQAGASGYIYKDRLADQLCTAINTVLQDQVYLSPAVATSFFRLFHFYNGHSVPSTTSVQLTEREHEVLHWLVQGASNNAIAKHLHISVATVKAHLTGIFEKLSVNSRTQAIVKALKLGLVSA